MAEFQLIGDKEKLKSGPRSMDRTEFSGGKFQAVGDSVSLKQTPVPLQQNKKGVSGGTFQKIGDSVTLGKTPIKGWQSHDTPISNRAKFASQMPGKK